MAIWKQFGLALVVLAAAFVAWIAFFPGARDMLAGAGIGGAGSRTSAGPAAGGEGRQRGEAEVIAAAIGRATINDRLQAIGTGRANASVSVNPFDSGRIAEVAVSPGQQVKAGDILARLDSDIQQIALDRAHLNVEDATTKLKRVQTLRTANTASAVQLADAQMVLSTANLAVRDADIALERRTIRAPIGGIVGIIPVEAGAYVTSQTAVATIDDRSRILVDFWVPERFASQIAVGQKVRAASVARPGEVIGGEVTAVDNRLDEASRTMQVQAAIPNDSDRLRAGMSFQVSMQFDGDSFPTVDPLAVQWGADGAFVWQIRDGKAVRTPVRIVQRNTESVLVDGDLPEGQMVVTQGIHLVRDGGDVRIAQRTPAGSGALAPLAQGS